MHGSDMAVGQKQGNPKMACPKWEPALKPASSRWVNLDPYPYGLESGKDAQLLP